jgi:hypothetical protein
MKLKKTKNQFIFSYFVKLYINESLNDYTVINRFKNSSFEQEIDKNSELNYWIVKNVVLSVQSYCIIISFFIK